MRGLFAVYRQSNRTVVIGVGWLIAAAGTVIAVVSMPGVHPLTVRFWSLVGGICLVVGGIAATLYCEPVHRYQVRLVWFFAGTLISAAGTAVIYFVLTQNPANKISLVVSGAALIMVGISTAKYSSSFRQWRRRLWLNGLGLLVLVVGALAAGSIAYVAGVPKDPTPEVVAVGIASVSLVGAVTIFVKAWRTPEPPPKQPRWHQVGR